MPLPTLVIAGAQKCGTSTLHGLLRDHPQVFMSRPKEVHFFDRHWTRGLDWCSSQFTPARAHVHAGESTPLYTYDAEARQRMTETLPRASIIVVLRDPTKRAYSHYWHSRRLGFETAPSFEAALDLEPARLASDERKARSRYSYVDRGHYIEQLLKLERAYGPDHLHIVLLEDLISDQQSCLERLFAFLGISTDPARTMQAQWKNRYRVSVGESKAKRPAEYPPMAPETRARLVEHFRADNDRLSAWLGRDLSEWNKP